MRLKSLNGLALVQVISGDADGAKRTQENFVNTAPVVSQIKSAVHAAKGDNEAAKKTQEQFAHNLEEVADGLPVVGHIKGGVHIGLGDREKGEAIIKGASSTTGSVIGGLLGGPAGAILGGIATDMLISGIDSAVHKESKPFGMVDYVININDKDAGEHFDTLFGIGLDAVGGAVAKTPSKGSFKKPGSPEVPKYPDSPSRPDIPDKAGYGAEQSPGRAVDRETGRQFENEKPINHFDNEESIHRFDNDESIHRFDNEESIHQFDNEESIHLFDNEESKHQFDNEESVHRFDNEESINQLSDDFHMDHSLREAPINLPENYKKLLETVDFRDVNDVNGITNCYFCTAAAMRDMSATQLMKKLEIDPTQVTHALQLDQIISLYKRVGWKDVKVIFTGDEVQFRKFVDNNVIPGEAPTTFALAYKYPNGNGHVVMMRAWKDQNSNTVNYLTTDYQRPLTHPDRFSTTMPKDAKTYNIICDADFCTMKTGNEEW
ncbi:hypothetical protein GE061_008325 [Apolygus lucorum]|uniref:Uncharacterized protein n=1 Tax=Apolygus lucorum TaxID=248454 RepID=A0A8S9WPJ6_APOLU|nr:hypothetical protein GE061_008325 [Apolygus lucorum]